MKSSQWPQGDQQDPASGPGPAGGAPTGHFLVLGISHSPQYSGDHLR